MRARRTIWRLTGSLSAVVAFPAKTRAWSRRSCVRTRRTDERLAGRDRHEGRRVRAALGHHLRSQRERRGELDLPNPGGAGGRLGRDRYCRVRRGGPHDHAPAQDLARAGRARLGTVSAREAVVAMLANNRILLAFREDVLGRARVFPGLKLAEHQMRFTSACRGASGSGEIRSGGGWRLGAAAGRHEEPWVEFENPKEGADRWRL